jgi:hypothetical protein
MTTVWVVAAHDIIEEETTLVLAATSREAAIHKLMGWMEEQANSYLQEADNSRHAEEMYEAYSNAAFGCEAMLQDTNLNSNFIPELEVAYTLYEG